MTNGEFALFGIMQTHLMLKLLITIKKGVLSEKDS